MSKTKLLETGTWFNDWLVKCFDLSAGGAAAPGKHPPPVKYINCWWHLCSQLLIKFNVKRCWLFWLPETHKWCWPPVLMCLGGTAAVLASSLFLFVVPSRAAVMWQLLTSVCKRVPVLLPQVYVWYTYAVLSYVKCKLYKISETTVHHCCIKNSHWLRWLLNVCGVIPVKCRYFINTSICCCWGLSERCMTKCTIWWLKRMRAVRVHYFLNVHYAYLYILKWWNPWPHVVNRHISTSQLLSFWRHSHYDVSRLQRSQPPFSLSIQIQCIG